MKKENLEDGKFSKCVIQGKWQYLKPHEDSLKKVKLVICYENGKFRKCVIQVKSKFQDEENKLKTVNSVNK